MKRNWIDLVSLGRRAQLKAFFAILLIGVVQSNSVAGEPPIVAVSDPDPAKEEIVSTSPSQPGPPLPIEMRITGTFGEPRSSHLHTGLDLSTGGEVGVPVLAVESGSLVRMKAGAFGYGRALYLQTDTGQLAVYGHLEKFAPSLEEYLREKQREKGEFEINLMLSPGEFRFSRGDTIAISGASGSGPPHLHFELRQGDDPLNPQLQGIRPEDRSTPDITDVIMRAMDKAAYVGGANIATVGDGGNRPLPVWGRVGVEAGIVDHCGLTNNRLTPLRIDLYLDQSRIFSRYFDRLDFSLGADVGRIYGRRPPGEQVWRYRLYRWPVDVGADQTDRSEGTGKIDFAQLSPGLHEFNLVVADAAGHSTSCSWAVSVEPPLGIQDCRVEFLGNLRWRLDLLLNSPAPGTGLPPWIKWRTKENKWQEMPLIEHEPGWFAAEFDGDEEIILGIVDNTGRPLAPLMAPPPETISLAMLDTSSIIVDSSIEEELLEITITPDRLLPGFPHCILVLESGERRVARFRGPGASGAWRFGLNRSEIADRSEEVRLEMSCASDVWERPLRNLISMGAGSNILRLMDNQLLIESDENSFFGEQLFDLSVHTSGDSLWRQIDAEGRALGREANQGDSVADQVRDRLILLSPILDLQPHWWPLAGSIRISFGLETVMAYRNRAEGNPNPSQWGIMRGDSKGRWSWLGLSEKDGFAGATSKSAGYFALMADTEAPRLVRNQPEDGLLLKIPPVSLRIGVLESGSGFDPQKADILLDGIDLLAEWDIDEKILSAPVDSSLVAGDHRWEVRITDRAGNQRFESFSFTIVP